MATLTKPKHFAKTNANVNQHSKIVSSIPTDHSSVLADHLAHQAVEDYQSMKFEFLDEEIMTLDNCKEFRPRDGPEQGSRWTLYFDGSLQCTWERYRWCAYISRRMPYSFHRQNLLQL